jgi:DNA-directed RNA polymerase subunit N (RpoN/RPB10)
MDLKYSYLEWPVRCFGCFEPIASRVEEYSLLVKSGYTKEEAMNRMNIMEPCSRAAFMAPSTVYLNVEDPDVVAGKSYLPKTYVLEKKVVHPIINRPSNIRPSRSELAEAPEVLENRVLNNDDLIYPTKVGEPTFNPDPYLPKFQIDVGGDYMIDVLGGRTYLAR